MKGLCLGGSSAINIAGAVRLAKDLGPGKTIVTLLCDSGTRYQSKLYNPDFLRSKKLAGAGLAGAQVDDQAAVCVRESCMPTDCLFREDAYLTSTPATVLGLTEKGGIVVDRTCFYATSGGQPGDSGVLVTPAGEFPLATAVYNDQLKTEIAHVPAEGVSERPAAGDNVTLKLDWGPRYRRMRMHTALHLLSAVLPYPVTGGAVNEDDSRLDFDIPEAGLDKDEITAKVNEMIKADAEVRSRWITDAELEANPGLVKTMSVKPPMGTGSVRLIEIVGFDLQPCGGTHVRRTGEIGAVRVTQIEKKGKQNRRVRISFA